MSIWCLWATWGMTLRMSSGAFTGSKIPHVLRQERHLISMTGHNLTALKLRPQIQRTDRASDLPGLCWPVKLQLSFANATVAEGVLRGRIRNPHGPAQRSGRRPKEPAGSPEMGFSTRRYGLPPGGLVARRGRRPATPSCVSARPGKTPRREGVPIALIVC